MTHWVLFLYKIFLYISPPSTPPISDIECPKCVRKARLLVRIVGYALKYNGLKNVIHPGNGVNIVSFFPG